MAVKSLRIYPDAMLFWRSSNVAAITEGVKEVAKDLRDTMEQHKAAGIAAVQIGEAMRVIVIANPNGEPWTMVNPTWSPAGTAKHLFDEGCLSFPGIIEKIERYTDVEATFKNLEGTLVIQSFTGIPAQAIQHECEHLDGEVFIQHLPTHRRDRIRTKLKQGQRRVAAFQKMVREGKLRPR